MRTDLFLPTAASEARLLILIDTFSRKTPLDGRTKMAKLDFFLRYPAYLDRALKILGKTADLHISEEESFNIEGRMIRYRFGPWDPSYYELLGRLIGRGLVEPIPGTRGLGFSASATGHDLALKLGQGQEWIDVAKRAQVLFVNMNWTGTRLKEFIYESFPEISGATWGRLL